MPLVHGMVDRQRTKGIIKRIDLEAPFTAERSSLSPLQLIAKASSAALELAETGDMEPALKVLTQLAKIWK